ncbi:hypothetical protein ACFT0G_35300 [Streptomyces sp. NPDC057020]|uniref:hypothetical protein n=1 Tax=unclassified Streptomyces TaxID=2593676 RepID=UPI00362FD292
MSCTEAGADFESGQEVGDVESRTEVLLEGLIVQGPGRSTLSNERDGGRRVLAQLDQGLCDDEAEAGAVVPGVTAHENGALIPYGIRCRDGQLLDRVELLSREWTIWDLTDQMTYSGVRSVAWSSEEADDQVELSTDNGGLHLAVRAGPEVPTLP